MAIIVYNIKTDDYTSHPNNLINSIYYFDFIKVFNIYIKSNNI